MEEIIRIFTDPSADLFVGLFFKAFAVLFSFLFLLYAIVITRQTQEMNQTVTTKTAPVLIFLSALHIALGLLLIAVSFILI